MKKKYFYEYFSFSVTRHPIGVKFQNATPPANDFWILSHFFWIFSSVVHTKVLLRFLKFWVSDFSEIFSSAWLCQQLCHEIENRPSYVIRLWHQLSLKLLHEFLSSFSYGFPWPICEDVFIFEKTNLYEYFSFSLTWDLMGRKFQNAIPPTNRSLPNGSHKTTFGIFEIMKIEILTNFICFL